MRRIACIAAHVRSLLEKARSLRDDRSGIAAVEFALLLPLMLALWLGATELSQAIAADRKATLTARSIADLCSQVTAIYNADMTNSLDAAAAVMAPYSASNLKVVVSSVSIDATGKATIAWSDTRNGTKRAVGSTITLPTGLNVANTSLIWSEVQYTYTPTIGYILTGSLTLKDQIFMRPRLSNTVTRVNS